MGSYFALNTRHCIKRKATWARIKDTLIFKKSIVEVICDGPEIVVCPTLPRALY